MSENYEIGGVLKALQSTKSKTEDLFKTVIPADDPPPGDDDTDSNDSDDSDTEMDGTANASNPEESGNRDLLNLFKYSPKDSYVFSRALDDVVDKEAGGVGDIQLEDETETGEEGQKKKKKKVKETKERLERTLFVGNIALNVQQKKVLRKIFLKFGKIETMRLRSFIGEALKIPKKVALIKKTFHSECQSLNAYIVYENKESVDKALVCNGMLVEGLHLRVDKVSQEKEHDHKKSLFVGNMPFTISEADLHKHFEKCGEIENVRVIRDQATGMGKGFGYVTFKTQHGVVFGLKLNGAKLNGRALRVSRSESSPRSQSNNPPRGGNKNNRNFCGLRSNVRKDREIGKKLVRGKSGAERRIKSKSKTTNMERSHGKKNNKKQKFSRKQSS